MLGFLFGFNARIGRLHYFLSLIFIGVVMAVLIYAATGVALRSSGGVLQLISLATGWVGIMLGIVLLFISVTLQSMRFRDMGWDPVCVIPGWMALMVIDRLIAIKMPAVALGAQTPQTAVGALVNLGLLLALTFWPSAAPDTPDFDEVRRRVEGPLRRDQGSTAAQRMARITGN